jgi:hypothetical protein
MTVHGPLREDHIGTFSSEHSRESLIVRVIDDGATVVLAGKNGPGPENLTRLLSFGCTDGGTTDQAGRAAEPFAPVQVQQGHVVAEVGVTCDRSGASALRIAWMTARDDYPE